ncbi:alpha-amylase family protein [Spongisporangium articulatum]|uniref:Alpha-amylase family protein n=1 Tax=Spongisporangium articulatum TaxID=3362603 RepID=A0ABW8APN8_9ACTN
MEPDWVRHAIWWQVYPLGFAGADVHRTGAPTPGGPRALEKLTQWLDYATRLGCNGLLLNPVSASSTHGYDTSDPFRVDERLGTEQDFDALVAACRERGLKLLLDGVFNHVGRDFPQFRAALEYGPHSAEAGWFDLDWDHRDAAGEPRARDFEGHPELVALHHASPAVEDHVVAVMNHWLARGADGWRLDAAYAVPKDFWARVSARVKGEHPQAYLLGEVIHGDYPGYVQSGLDSVTQYELWKAVWSSLNDRNFFELSWALKRHDELVESFAPFTFVGNHDVTRIASRLGDARHLAHALVLLFTLAGTPAVYYGDEQAFRGVKEDRAGGDDAVRPAFPPSEADLAPEGWATYRLHQDLIGLRRRHPWLHRARLVTDHLANGMFAYTMRDGEQHLHVALNLTDDVFDTPTGLSAPPHGWAVSG